MHVLWLYSELKSVENQLNGSQIRFGGELDL